MQRIGWMFLDFNEQQNIETIFHPLQLNYSSLKQKINGELKRKQYLTHRTQYRVKPKGKSFFRANG